LQGREKDVAIFSTVRTQVGRSIGFVADERRMNVGLTRARSSLIVIGNAKALNGDERWGNLIKQATVDRSASGGPTFCWYWLCHSMTCCSVLCCAVLHWAVLGCAVLWLSFDSKHCCDSCHASKAKMPCTTNLLVKRHLLASLCICMGILHWVESVLVLQMSLPAC